MKVVIPLAGFGTRLRPHTYTKPKPLVNVAGKPVLGHILDKLLGLEIEEIIFIVGYLGEQIEHYVDTHYQFNARYVEQKEMLGQAHAIFLARDFLPGSALTIFVDTIFETDLSSLDELEADGVVYVKEVEDPRRFGVVVLEEGHITRLIEKPSSLEHNLAIVGLYYVKDMPWLMRAIDQLMEEGITTDGEYYLADALQIMIDDGARLIARPVEVWKDCGKPETVLDTNRYLLTHGCGNGVEIEAPDSLIVPPVHIAPSARIVHSIIGPYVTIAPRCEVRGSVIRDSIIDEGAHIADTMLEQSLIGKGAIVKGRYQKLNVGDSSSVDLGS
ncbi:MAG: sugar phosphate nucleotidyltransferase [Chloroflexota bacterium]|nr:sugar phosphate nucleotidyltransferase [Chloroflexota bacterium]